MTATLSDLRYALRRLRARPLLSAVLVLSIALGISANVVIFSLARGLLGAAGAFPEPHRLVALWFTPPENPGARMLATQGNCSALRERVRRFEHLGCVFPERSATIADAPHSAPSSLSPTHVTGQEFSATVPAALRARPVLGRWFTSDEERRADPVVVISHGLWQRRLAGAPDIVGRRIRVSNQGLRDEVVTIIGVAPAGFHLFDSRADYWLPLASPPAGSASPARNLLVVGRLEAGSTIQQARSEVAAIAAALAQETPFTNQGWGIRIEPLDAVLDESIGRPMRILRVVVVLVLLIACANVAGLLLAEGVARRAEISLRIALGATRGRIAAQWLTEGLLLAVSGAVIALVVAWLGLRILVASLPAGLPGIHAVSLDPAVLAFTAAIALLTALAFSTAPALHASRTPGGPLNRSVRQGSTPRSGHRLRSAFVVAQISLAGALSIGAGLMIHSLMRLRAVDTGIETSNLVTFQVQFDGREYLRDTGRTSPSGAPETELTVRLRTAAEEVRVRLAAIGGIESVTAVAATLPLSGTARRYGFTAAGGLTTAADARPAVTDWFAILPDYFATLGMPVLRGRGVDATDTAAAPAAIVINRSLAEELWPGEDPVGREIQLRLYNDPPRRIIGVAADVRHDVASRERPRHVYVPLAQMRPLQSGLVAHGLERLTYVVRSSESSATLAQAFRDVVAQVDPNRLVGQVQPLQRHVDDQLHGYRHYVVLLGLFGAVALILALVGTYGLIAHAVRLRFGEVGIRLALGATPRQALWSIMRQGVVLSAAGVALGMIGGLMFSGVLESYLWEVTVTDPLTFAVVSILIATVSTAASYLAARPALTVDPMDVIRHE